MRPRRSNISLLPQLTFSFGMERELKIHHFFSKTWNLRVIALNLQVLGPERLEFNFRLLRPTSSSSFQIKVGEKGWEALQPLKLHYCSSSGTGNLSHFSNWCQRASRHVAGDKTGRAGRKRRRWGEKFWNIWFFLKMEKFPFLLVFYSPLFLCFLSPQEARQKTQQREVIKMTRNREQYHFSGSYSFLHFNQVDKKEEGRGKVEPRPISHLYKAELYYFS